MAVRAGMQASLAFHPSYRAPFCLLNRWNQKKAKSVHEPTVYRPYFIIIISIVNVILLAASIGVNDGTTRRLKGMRWTACSSSSHDAGIESLSRNPLIGPSAETLLDLGAKYSPYMTSADGAWRFITPMFLYRLLLPMACFFYILTYVTNACSHVGIIHLLFNLCSQLQMVILEKKYGCHRIIPIYFLSGVAGTLASAIFVPNQIMVLSFILLFLLPVLVVLLTGFAFSLRWELRERSSVS